MLLANPLFQPNFAFKLKLKNGLIPRFKSFNQQTY